MKFAKKMKKILVTTALVVTGTLAIGGTSSKAALQANYTTHTKGSIYTGSALIKSIREMETSGQTMGLNETVNATSLLSPTNNSNGIDVHMMKSTEYGAVAILSASGFGVGDLRQSTIKTTTGNITGVYMGTRYEWVAGICDTTNTVKSINARYYDKYAIDDQTSAKVGDALGKIGTGYETNPGCYGWHGAGNSSWLGSTSGGFKRGRGGMFSFNFSNWTSDVNCGRGVAVVGENL